MVRRRIIRETDIDHPGKRKLTRSPEKIWVMAGGKEKIREEEGEKWRGRENMRKGMVKIRKGQRRRARKKYIC